MLLDQVNPLVVTKPQPVLEQQTNGRYTKIALQEFKKHQQLFERLKRA